MVNHVQLMGIGQLASLYIFTVVSVEEIDPPMTTAIPSHANGATPSPGSHWRYFLLRSRVFESVP